MKVRRLGRTGLRVSSLCLGTMQFGWTADEPTAHRILDRALDSGVNFIDTADVYSRWVEGNPGGVAEEIVGRWMAAQPGRRQQVVVATKVRGRMGEGPNDEGLSRLHILQAVEASLRRLGTDHIDLYQVHSPDDDAPIDETLEALTDLVRRGLVLYLGCSNFKAWQVVESLWTSDRRRLSSFVSVQPHHNLVHRREYEAELEAVCVRYGLGVLPYSPLAGGFLTGKYRRGTVPPPRSRGATSGRIRGYLERPSAWEVLDHIERIAGTHGATASQVALAWSQARPGITSPIIGPRDLDQLEDNLASIDLSLSREDLDSLNAVSAWSED